MDRHRSRREVLRTGTAVATIGVTSALPGCQGAIRRVVDGDQSDSIETVRKWTPAPPGDASESDRTPAMFPVKYRQPKTLAKVDDRTDTRLTSGPRYLFNRWIWALPIQYSEVPYVLYVGPTTGLFRYDHDPSEPPLTSGDFQKQSEYRGFEVYASGSGDGGDADSSGGSGSEVIYAFDGTHVVRSRRDWPADSDSKPLFELVIDAHDGAVGRYVEGDDHVEAMLRATNPGDLLDLSRGGTVSPFGDLRGEKRLDRHVGYCLSGRYGSTVAEFQLLVDFETSDEADVATVKRFVEAHRDDEYGFRGADNFAYRRLDHMVEVTFRIPLEAFQGPSPPPDIRR